MPGMHFAPLSDRLLPRCEIQGVLARRYRWPRRYRGERWEERQAVGVVGKLLRLREPSPDSLGQPGPARVASGPSDSSLGLVNILAHCFLARSAPMGGCWQRRLRWKRIVDPDLDAASAAPWARDIRRPSLSPLKPTAQ